MGDENESPELSAEKIAREEYSAQLQQRYDKGALYAAGRMLLMLGIPTVLYFFPEWNGNLPTGWKSTGEIIVTGGGILLGSCLVGLYEWDCLQPKLLLLTLPNRLMTTTLRLYEAMVIIYVGALSAVILRLFIWTLRQAWMDPHLVTGSVVVVVVTAFGVRQYFHALLAHPAWNHLPPAERHKQLALAAALAAVPVVQGYWLFADLFET